jgi:hypothetical protein
MSSQGITASEMGKRSARTEKRRIGTEAYAARRREIGSLGGRAKKLSAFEARVALAVRSITAAGISAGATTPKILAAVTTLATVAAEAGLPIPTTTEARTVLGEAIRKAIAAVAEEFATELDGARKAEAV